MKKQKICLYFPYEKSFYEGISSIASKLENYFSPEETEIHFLVSDGFDGCDAVAASSLFDGYKCYFESVGKYIFDGCGCYKFAIPIICKSDKAIFINPDSKTELNLGKIATVELGNYYVAAYHDISFDAPTLSDYTEKVLGINHYLFASGDCAVFNVKKLKENGAYERYISYRNFSAFSFMRDDSLFNLVFKDRILIIGDIESGTVPTEACMREIESENSFLAKWNREKRAGDRVAICKKIDEFEKNGTFDIDVEDDVPGRTIMPEEIEYVKKTAKEKLKAKIAFSMAKRFYYKLEKKKMVMINDEVDGLENLANLDTGAVITCNHFNAMDSFAMHWVYLKSKQKKRKLYRVIREGNYTSFPGFFGFLMRNFYTLPLSSNHKTMRKFMEGVNELLKSGNFVLVYPEQSMWWNYRKPKPLKPGAFSFAAKNGVPVLPIFISMRDSGVLGPDGYYVQEYKMHIGKPIYPDAEKGTRENVDTMMKENERVWKEFYEREYQIPLEYTTEVAPVGAEQ